MKRILIGGTHSGCGKTTITCAVLKALFDRGLRVSAFKCGPDYIDPMFHKNVIGVPSHNLDSYFCDNDTLRYLLMEYGGEISVIEGVMGYYDGADRKTGRGSAHSISQITETPSVLVVNCRGMSNSIGALVSGFLNYRKNHIKGVIFNELPERLEPMAREICAELHTEYLGRFPKCDFSFESRHLGLVTPEEFSDIKDKLKRLGKLAEQYLDLDNILEISECGELSFTPPNVTEMGFTSPPVIAVAEDAAFCFQYAENLDLLKKLGCEIVRFSPVEDSEIPECDGLILCGGYPELYAERLSKNAEMLRSVREVIERKTPYIAECGGFMYLHEKFPDNNGNLYNGVGVVRGAVFKTEKLQRFGYAELIAEHNNLLCVMGEKFRVHEFHYFDSENSGTDFTAVKADGREWKCAHSSENFYMGFPHLYFYSNIETARRFARKAAEFGGKQ